MLEAIEKRISRRSFEKDDLTDKELKQIQTYIDETNKKPNLSISLLTNGSYAFKNLARSYGIFDNVKTLILMKGKKKEANLDEKVDYFGEELVLKITNLDIGTCWVGGTFEKDKIDLENNEQLICVIAVGKVAKLNLKEKAIRKMMSEKRKTIEHRLISDTTNLPQWITDGMEAVRLAPSAKNSQKPMFEYNQGILRARVPVDAAFDLVDLGIAKKHFEIAGQGIFKLGNGEAFEQLKKGE